MHKPKRNEMQSPSAKDTSLTGVAGVDTSHIVVAMKASDVIKPPICNSMCMYTPTADTKRAQARVV